MLREQKQRQASNKAYRAAARKGRNANPPSMERHCKNCGGNYLKNDYHACR